MSNTKIQCNHCGAKFFTLDREEIDCKCGHRISVKDQLKNHNRQDSFKSIHEEEIIVDIDDSFVEEDEL